MVRYYTLTRISEIKVWSFVLRRNDPIPTPWTITSSYKLEKELDELIVADVANKKYWDNCKELLDKSKKVCISLSSLMCLFHMQ